MLPNMCTYRLPLVSIGLLTDLAASKKRNDAAGSSVVSTRAKRGRKGLANF
jgi:hypothetical protein